MVTILFCPYSRSSPVTRKPIPKASKNNHYHKSVTHPIDTPPSPPPNSAWNSLMLNNNGASHLHNIITIILVDKRRMPQKNKHMYEWKPQSTTHKSHEKINPLSEENTGTKMLSTCKIFPRTKKNDNARILSNATARPHACMWLQQQSTSIARVVWSCVMNQNE